MKTFSEKLQVTKNLKLLEQTFELMYSKNIDPVKFIDWYQEYEITKQGCLIETSQKWLSNELILVEGTWDQWMHKGKSNVAVAPGAQPDHSTGSLPTSTQPQQNAPQPQQPQQNAPQPQQTQQNAPQPQQTQQPQNVQPQQSVISSKYVQDAKNAISMFHKRLYQSKDMQSKLGGTEFGQMLLNLIQMLQDEKQYVPAQQPQQNANPTSASYETPSFESYIHKTKLNKEIYQGLKDIQNYGVNPQDLVEFYIAEGMHLDENLFQRVGDWLGNTWANVKGAWNRWGQDGRKRQAEKETQRDKESLQNAMQSLDQLEQGMKSSNVSPSEDFAKLLGAVKEKLQQANAQPQPPQEPEQQNQEQQPPEQNQTEPESDDYANAQTDSIDWSGFNTPSFDRSKPVSDEVMNNYRNPQWRKDNNVPYELEQEIRDIETGPDEDKIKHEKIAYLLRKRNSIQDSYKSPGQIMKEHSYKLRDRFRNV